MKFSVSVVVLLLTFENLNIFLKSDINGDGDDNELNGEQATVYNSVIHGENEI